MISRPVKRWKVTLHVEDIPTITEEYLTFSEIYAIFDKQSYDAGVGVTAIDLEEVKLDDRQRQTSND
jgi:hypothetical protein